MSLLSSLGTAGGAGALGLAGQVLSAARRGLWSMLGGPEHGNELVSNIANALGAPMDPESPWANVLGFGAEVLGDPLTYAGGLLGGPLAKMGGSLRAGKAWEAAALE